MQKVGPYVLLFMLVFALVFAFLPTGEQPTAQTGATLRGVKLTLYPSRDPDAIWQFGADKVVNDPLSGTTVLSGLSGGQRLVRQKTPQGQYTGQTTLDATLQTPGLTIDGQDNLSTQQAKVYLLSTCADIDLVGSAAQPVLIEQGMGFSTPLAVVDSPFMKGRLTDMRMTFDFNLQQSGTDSVTRFPLDPTEDCVRGKRVPVQHT